MNSPYGSNVSRLEFIPRKSAAGGKANTVAVSDHYAVWLKMELCAWFRRVFNCAALSK
jgi:hypothetical protein